MTKEAIDIQKEIEKYFTESAGFGRDKIQNFMDIVNKALKQKGEQIAELEKENAELKEKSSRQSKNYKCDVGKLLEENAEWKKRNETLKDALEHARKVYGDELEKSYKEIAELKGIKDVATLIRANNDTVVTLMQLNNMLVSKSQQLTKAKELLKKVIKVTWGEGWNYSLDVKVEAEQFLKDSEV